MTIQTTVSGLLADVAIDLKDIFRFPDGQLPSGFVETRIRREPLPTEVSEMGLGELARKAALQLWGLAEAKIRRGIRLRIHADRRVVRLFDYVDYKVFDQERRVQATFDDARNGQFQAAVYVGSPLPHSGWTNNILIRALPDWREALRADLGTRPQRSTSNGDQDSIVKAIERWSLGVLQCVVARWIDLPRLRATLRHLMHIDPQTLRLARRVGLGRGVSGGVTSLELDEIARWQHHLLEIEACAPALLDLFWIERKRWSAPTGTHEPLRSLRRDFKRLGVSVSGWKRLCHHPARPIWKHWHAKRIRNVAELKQFLADWARLHASLPANVKLPAAMWEALALTFVDPDSDVVHPPVNWPCHAKVTAEAIAAYHASRVIGLKGTFLQGDWARVVRWAADYRNEGRASLKRTWAGALRAAELEERRMRAESATSSLVWSTPFKESTVGNLIASPVTNEIDLIEEAISMRHCVDAIDRNKLGQSIHVVSIRCAATSRRIATACFAERRGRYVIREIRGVANTPAITEAVRAARMLQREGLNNPTNPRDFEARRPKSLQPRRNCTLFRAPPDGFSRPADALILPSASTACATSTGSIARTASAPAPRSSRFRDSEPSRSRTAA